MINKVEFVMHVESLLIGMLDMSVRWSLTQIRSEINEADCCQSFFHYISEHIAHSLSTITAYRVLRNFHKIYGMRVKLVCLEGL
jgi:hypothetical protein